MPWYQNTQGEPTIIFFTFVVTAQLLSPIWFAKLENPIPNTKIWQETSVEFHMCLRCLARAMGFSMGGLSHFQFLILVNDVMNDSLNMLNL